MKQLDKLQKEVGTWSEKNFGHQASPHFRILVDKEFEGDPPKAMVALDSLAPLLGLVEEYGELLVAMNTKIQSKHDIEDAIGDIIIYSCDFCHRFGIVMPFGRHAIKMPDDIKLHEDPLVGIGISLGRMYHATLKRHQGIRGFDNDANYAYEIILALQMILVHLDHLAGEVLNDNILIIANRTWNNIVSKRDWKTSPVSGQSNE